MLQEMNRVDVPGFVSEVYQTVLSGFPDVLNVNHVSDILGVSSKTVYRLLNNGSITSLKVGRAYKVPKIHMYGYALDSTN